MRQLLHFAYGFVSRREFHRHRSYNRSVALSLAPRVISRTNDCGDHAQRFHSFDGVMAKASAGASNACRTEQRRLMLLMVAWRRAGTVSPD